MLLLGDICWTQSLTAMAFWHQWDSWFHQKPFFRAIHCFLFLHFCLGCFVNAKSWLKTTSVIVQRSCWQKKCKPDLQNACLPSSCSSLFRPNHVFVQCHQELSKHWWMKHCFLQNNFFLTHGWLHELENAENWIEVVRQSKWCSANEDNLIVTECDTRKGKPPNRCDQQQSDCLWHFQLKKDQPRRHDNAQRASCRLNHCIGKWVFLNNCVPLTFLCPQDPGLCKVCLFVFKWNPFFFCSFLPFGHKKQRKVKMEIRTQIFKQSQISINKHQNATRCQSSNLGLHAQKHQTNFPKWKKFHMARTCCDWKQLSCPQLDFSTATNQWRSATSWKQFQPAKNVGDNGCACCSHDVVTCRFPKHVILRCTVLHKDKKPNQKATCDGLSVLFGSTHLLLPFLLPPPETAISFLPSSSLFWPPAPTCNNKINHNCFWSNCRGHCEPLCWLKSAVWCRRAHTKLVFHLADWLNWPLHCQKSVEEFLQISPSCWLLFGGLAVEIFGEMCALGVQHVQLLHCAQAHRDAEFSVWNETFSPICDLFFFRAMTCFSHLSLHKRLNRNQLSHFLEHFTPF